MRAVLGRWAAVVVTMVSITACSATSSGAPTAAPGGPASAVPVGNHAVPAVILGDSLSVQANTRYQERIPGVVVDAVIGRTVAVANLTDDGLSRVPELRTVDAAWFVVELGTNDSTFAAYPSAQMAADVTAMLDAIGRDRCIAWVLPYATTPRTAIQIADTERFRAIAATEVAALPCGLVLDWGELVAKDPHLVADDGVHLSDQGIVALADLIAFGVA